MDSPSSHIDPHRKGYTDTEIITAEALLQLGNNRLDQFQAIQKEGLELFSKKNKDYGDAFAKFGIIGILMRIEDKIQRAICVDKNKVALVNDETIKDTLIDLHNYAAMGLMLLEED
jgi:hypothetical protein